MAVVPKMVTMHVQKPVTSLIWLLTFLTSDSTNFMLSEGRERNFANINVMLLALSRSAMAIFVSYVIDETFSKTTAFSGSASASNDLNSFSYLIDFFSLAIVFVAPYSLLQCLLIVLSYGAPFAVGLLLLAKIYSSICQSQWVSQSQEDSIDSGIMSTNLVSKSPSGRGGINNIIFGYDPTSKEEMKSASSRARKTRNRSKINDGDLKDMFQTKTKSVKRR